MLGSSGIQFNYNETNLVASLSGEALAQHSFNSTGFIVRTGSLAYSGRAITNGSNIQVTNGDGISGNPVVALSGSLTGLGSVTATTFSGTLVGNADTASQVKTTTSSANSNHYLTFVDSDNSSATAETVYSDSDLSYNPSTNTLTTNVLSVNSLSVTSNAVIGGDLTVNGTTVTANVDSMVVEDPIITLGKPSGTIAAENKDRGVEFVYPSGNSTVAATGFFGFDKSATEFIAARDVTINNEEVTVNSYLDARFNDIDGSTITASTQFSGPGTGLTGTASGLTVGKADNLVGGEPGSIVYQESSDTTTFLDLGSTGQFLRVAIADAPEWYTLSYSDIAETPTIGDATLTFSVNGSGLSIGSDSTFTANSTTAKTFSVTSNATPGNSGNAIVSRDSSGNFSAGSITANLSGTATNADNINVDEKNDDVNYQVLFSANNGTGYQRPYIDTDDAQFTYNPNTKTLTVANFAGNASTVTNGVYTTGPQNIGGAKTFTDIVVSNSGLNSYNSSSFYLNLQTNPANTFGVYYADGDGEGGSILLSPSVTAGASTTIVGQATTDIELLLPTSSGTLALISDITVSNLTGTLPVNKGGTGATTLTGALIGNGTSAVSAVSSTTPYALFRVNSDGNGYEFSVVIDGGTP